MRLTFPPRRRTNNNQQQQQQPQQRTINYTESWKQNNEDDVEESQNTESDLMTIEEFISSLGRMQQQEGRENRTEIEQENQLMTVEEFIFSCKEPTTLFNVYEQQQQRQQQHDDDHLVSEDEDLVTVEEFIYTSEKRDNSNDMLTIEEFLNQSNNGRIYHKSNLIY